ncbi:probable plastid-lipid-associated protein 13, chloroplastic [Selaginella moellendorffii]|uniref:probable plastid-lipid-associated protein 13, chloroplastic n=1 Tax=Selaginella moellendorffii TaxID=88036 RepID=UPI000D1C80E0|nr:probable plastid-lipid-associated protein 13, chloroplastic [Selaginella moellendorffii]|eukprot:XP_024518758.1 probable plastid-lipid-associated protein 13, chloroplastic [Selaginella moellendorffii]
MASIRVGGAPAAPAPAFPIPGAQFRLAVSTISAIPAPRRLRRRLVTRAANPSTALFAKEMERVAAKEALLFAVKDAGGLNASNDAAVLDICEKLLAVERLNPTPRPTTSPLLEGLWNLEWAGARFMASKVLITTFPALLSIEGVTLRVMDGMARATLNLKFLNSIETSFILTTNISAQGPLRLKEQYVDGVIAPPLVKEGSIPTQVQGIYDQFVAAAHRLPESVKDSVSGGLKLPLGGGLSYERLLLISYLDEEVLVVRDPTGAPEVLSRLEVKSPVPADPEIGYYK